MQSHRRADCMLPVGGGGGAGEGGADSGAALMRNMLSNSPVPCPVNDERGCSRGCAGIRFP